MNRVPGISEGEFVESGQGFFEHLTSLGVALAKALTDPSHSRPSRVAMLLTGHKSRAIFDRYNIINEQELLDAGDQLVAYLAQQAQAPRGHAHPTGAATTRTALP